MSTVTVKKEVLSKVLKIREDLDSSLEDDGLEIVQVTPSLKKRSNDNEVVEITGLEVLQVTPPPKKRSKKKTDVVITDVRNPLRVTRELALYKESYTIVTVGRPDGANVLSTVPGGYIGLYGDCEYTRLLHKHLDFEIRTWCERVLAFVQDIEKDAPNLFNKIRSKKIKEFVLKKIFPLRKVLQDKHFNIVVHALNMTAIKAFFQCEDKTAKFVFYMCAAFEFELKFSPELEDKSYEIFTLFSHGKCWYFGEECE